MHEREARALAVRACAGAMAQVTVAICDSASVFSRLRSAWYCSQASLGRSVITAIVPTVLLLTWQNLIMPNAVRGRSYARARR